MTKKCFLVTSASQYWGRGKTVKQAAIQCHKAGARKTDKVMLNLIIGDDKASITSAGYIEYEQSSTNICLGRGYKIGNLMTLSDE